ncbi:MAG: phosphotransferase [Pseudomonadota bacterium]
MTDVPATVDDITPDWLNEALFDNFEPRATEVKITKINDDRGFLSQTLRLDLTYDAPSDGRPSSLVAKIKPNDDTFRQAAAEISAFEREVGFYREVAPRVSVRLPLVYFAEQTPKASALVMEDLGHLTVGDQVHGIAHQWTRTIAQKIAKVHAVFWDNAALKEIDWAPEHDHFHTGTFVEAWPAFADAFDLRLGKRAMEIGAAVADNLDALERRIAERPATLVHGDLRADNLMFGKPGETDEVLMLDWQLVHKTNATYDIARLMGGSEPVPEREGHQLEIIRCWHESLTDAGVANYPFDEALNDHRLSALHCLTIPVKFHYLVGPEPEGRAGRLLDVMAERFFAAAIELDADSAMPR